jgi:hypothetical protein
MMSPLDFLRQDQAALADILAARQTVTTVTLPVGARMLWGIYLVILEDALATLRSLIEFLERRL